MATLEEIKIETEHLKGTLVLDHYSVVLFIGVTDGVDDYYYELQSSGRKRPYWSSCVGWIIPLKDKMDKAAYNYLASVWNHNNDTKIKEIE